MRRVFFLCLFCPLMLAWPSRADQVPVAPLSTLPGEEGGEIYRVEAGPLTVEISPAGGGIASLNAEGAGTLLRSPLRVAVADAPPAGSWDHRGWKTGDGTAVVMLSRGFGPPLGLRVVHLIEIPPEGNGLRQQSRITATGPGTRERFAPAAAWTAPSAASIWRPASETSPCGGWSLEPDGKAPARILEYDGLLAFWRCAWSMEAPGASVESEGLSAESTGEALRIRSRPRSLDAPPRGWTLTAEIRLRLRPIGADAPVCEEIAAWDPDA